MYLSLKNKLQIIIQNRMLHHLLFWMASFYVLVHYFAYEEGLSKIDYVYTALFHISLVTGVYLNLLLIIPYLLKKEKYLVYIPAIIILLGLVAFINQFTFETLSDWLAPGYFFISAFEFSDLLKFSFVYLALSTLLKLSKSWFRMLEAEKQLEAMKRKHSETELSALKSNINPHFLFNNLNSLYALARKKSDETPNYILKLSELMRYMIYETKDQYVSLEKELDYITNYLELQKLRSKNKERIKYAIQGEINSQTIAPFLMIPFIENSFKHGGLNQLDRDIIDLNIKLDESELQMHLKNSIPCQTGTDLDKIGGFGIENVKSRLQSLYGTQHNLSLSQTEDEFIVKLKIKLKHEPNP